MPRKAQRRAFRIVLHAVHGFGKTTIGAYAPKPFMLMGNGETGYDVLLAAGRVPAVPGARVEKFADALNVLDMLAAGRGDIETVVIDSASTFEDMLMSEVCTKHFDGDPGPNGFQSYGKGYGIVSTEWMKLIARLDRLAELGCNVLVLAHTATTSFKNPMGADYKRYTIDLYDSEKASTQAPLNQFADAVLFGNFLSVVEVGKGEQRKNIAEQKGKGIGDTVRMIYAERRDAYDAKNRYGMTPSFELPDDPSQAWARVWQEIVGKDA